SRRPNTSPSPRGCSWRDGPKNGRGRTPYRPGLWLSITPIRTMRKGRGAQLCARPGIRGVAPGARLCAPTNSTWLWSIETHDWVTRAGTEPGPYRIEAIWDDERPPEWVAVAVGVRSFGEGLLRTVDVAGGCGGVGGVVEDVRVVVVVGVEA